jgi:hypothetical protein
MTPGLRTNVYTSETVPSQPPKSADAVSLAAIASAELEQLAPERQRQSFPAACRALLLEIDGNNNCIDCGRKAPEWAAVSYGALVCLYCSGTHRGLGVNVSTVRSITMDHWTHDEVVKMLEGGNRQLSTFFQRHSLVEDAQFLSPQLNRDNIVGMRYKTKAALFYRQQLEHHCTNLIARGPYKGRRRKRRPLGTQASNLE